MLFVATATLAAMLGELLSHIEAQNWLLTAISAGILVLDVWILIEGIGLLVREPSARAEPTGA